MSLQDKLNALKEKFEAMTPPEKLAIMHRATEDLGNSGLVEKVPRAGDKAPDFSLKDVEGKTINLHSLLEQGPVVLSFFRGGW